MYKRDLVESILKLVHSVISKLVSLFSLIVIGSELPDKDKSNINSIAWKIHFLYSEGPEIQALNPLD